MPKDNESLSDRVGHVAQFVGTYATQKAAAEDLGLSPSQLSKALNVEAATPGRLATVEGAIAQRKLRARGSDEVERETSQALGLIETGGRVPPGYTRVLEILIEPSASDVWDVGTEEEVEAEEAPSDTFFPDWYIRSEYGVSPDRIRFARVRGDSMTPTILPGQRLVVALLPPGSTLRDGVVYLIVGPGGAQVKRLIIEPDHVHVWSDNPDRPRFRVGLETFERDYRVVAVVLETNQKL